MHDSHIPYNIHKIPFQSLSRFVPTNVCKNPAPMGNLKNYGPPSDNIKGT